MDIFDRKIKVKKIFKLKVVESAKLVGGPAEFLIFTRSYRANGLARATKN
jgi:hypothetical protein